MSDFVEFMQQSIGDAMVDEMGKGLARLDWLVSDFVATIQQNICDAIMNEMNNDDVGLIDWFLIVWRSCSKASAIAMANHR